MTKTPFETSQSHATKPLELVHTDLTGSIRTETTIDKHRYAINFVDNFSRFVKVYTIKIKSDAFSKIKQFIADYGKPRRIRSNKGGEYESNEYVKFCLDNGIRREETITGMPEQNARSERSWRTLTKMTQAMLDTPGLC